MTSTWYSAAALGYSYFGAGAILLLLILLLRKILSDSALWHRVRSEDPAVGCAGTFRVLSAGGKRLKAGQLLSVPYEGTMGSSRGCDVVIPFRRVHMRSAFFWMEKDGLHVVPLHRDGFTADDVAIGAGDEAVLEDGAVLCVGDLKLVLRLGAVKAAPEYEAETGPYVTGARRTQARKGRGDGLGDPGAGRRRTIGHRKSGKER